MRSAAVSALAVLVTRESWACHRQRLHWVAAHAPPPPQLFTRKCRAGHRPRLHWVAAWHRNSDRMHA
eukprot:CAMPEP_0171210042 /NCGR_PEP_ID=MMETSP0790-20130122/28904_1 /TAXON_ID=2925 /ORGANISM="Alexandrium catenella, Strain OF101" /LENGTH=66 /DNA_ID=CAMNT_0011675665 /DNA_START=76 /DNA_END=272 /DNA_ORIENTATION=+